ncbi:MAG: FHA domain-containing protein [Iphinoe sp. HA4291-MV1]|jgi:hypothetical protein|nr:FHA domain-containing protein [Iphinoe sp. HA4291-MV1]
MNLNLFLEQTGQSWTLRPNREYIVGSGNDCDIPLSNVNVVSAHHLKFIFHQPSNSWHVSDLGSSNGVFINNQRITDYPIQIQTRIAIAGGIFLVATPEEVRQVQSAIPTPPFYVPDPPPPNTFNQAQGFSPQPFQPPVPVTSSSLRVLTWGEYVESQVFKAKSWWDQIAVRYFLTTGLRNTPWITFDGYIIPNFKESAEKIAVGIEANLNQLKRYEDTDCQVVLLTDAHLIDTSRAVFSGIELLALKRANRRDFRRFCVVYHHRIRTYVIVDNYGPDLFIGRLTRFESQPDGFIPVVILAVAILIALFMSSAFSPLSATLSSSGSQLTVFLWVLIIITGLWTANYLAVPWLMQRFRILPKPSNTMIIWLLILGVLWIFLFLLTILFPPFGTNY